MKRVAFVLCFLPLAMALAEEARDASTPLAWQPPDENSPLFMSNADLLRDERLITAVTAPGSQYPLAPKSTEPAIAKVRNFFNGVFSAVGGRAAGESLEEASIRLEPESPNLSESRELSVDYTVRNTSGRMVRLEFPTGQHIDIQAKNSAGSVIERWSDDRSFPQGESVVVVNPDERIEYREKISTREMKAGSSYEVEAFLKTQPDLLQTAPLVPR